MTFRLIAVLGILAAFACPQIGHAEDRITTCDYCTASQYPNAALSVVSYGTEYVYVVNRPTRTIKRFLVIIESEPGHSISEATEVATEPGMVQDIQKLLDFHEFVAKSRTVPSALVGTNVDSALDIVHSSARMDVEQAVYQFYVDNAIPLIAGSAINNPTSIVTMLEGGDGLLTIEFPNGSEYSFKITDITNLTNGDPTIMVDSVLGSGRDGDGKTIPESTGDLPGITRTGDSAPDYVDLVNRMGISVEVLPRCKVTATFACQVVGSELHCSINLACQ